MFAQLIHFYVVVCSTYKWLLGPYGHAFAYYSDEIIKVLAPQHASWMNCPTFYEKGTLLAYTTETFPGARQYDRGQAPNILLMSGLEGSLNLFNELGLENIENHNQSLVNHFLENVKPTEFEMLTPKDAYGNILCLKVLNQDALELSEKLAKEHNIDVSVREGRLRLSFHFFNTTAQVEKLITALS